MKGVTLLYDESNKYLQSEMTKWAKVIREAGITAD